MAVLKRTRSRIIAAVAFVVVGAFVALTLLLFVFPDLNMPQRANAIVVLGGNGAGPFDEGVALARAGDAPTIVFSLVPAYSCEPSAVHLPQEQILCFRANPQTTQGEARSIAHLASVHHWHRIIVVMPTTQATRARLRIGRCYPGQVLEVGVTPPGFWAWVRGIVYEWGALGKALVLQPGC
ncbi:MAG TPA: hypothetical protein VHD39_06565 [Acidimicrobiales bacterium]|nr:hypothetical protein [Acidimicrobiales bacterium]